MEKSNLEVLGNEIYQRMQDLGILNSGSPQDKTYDILSGLSEIEAKAYRKEVINRRSLGQICYQVYINQMVTLNNIYRFD